MNNHYRPYLKTDNVAKARDEKDENKQNEIEVKRASDIILSHFPLYDSL
jgi:hypothetical protein